MNTHEIRQRFLDYFKKEEHTIVPSSSLVPEGDPSVLLTTAGMQQFKPYFMGKKDPVEDFGSKNVASVQKSFRTTDIEEVGDETHLTFFEMLGNFSFGGYFKEDAIKYAYEFITEEMGLGISFVSIFGGDEQVKKDAESEEIWKTVAPDVEIKTFGREDNFWGPTGDEGPCGPTTEIYVKSTSGEDVEIWNLVFNQYYCNKDGSLEQLKTPGVDTGMGLERLAAIKQGKGSVFDIDVFKPIITYTKRILLDSGTFNSGVERRALRIVADHVRGAVFLIADGVKPEKTGRGAILRRLIRKAYEDADMLNLLPNALTRIASKIIPLFKDFYSELSAKEEVVSETIRQELKSIKKRDERADKKLEEVFDEYMEKQGKSPLKVRKIEPGKRVQPSNPFISPEEAFHLYSTHGIQKRKIIKFMRKKGYLGDLDKWEKYFTQKIKEHQEISRQGSGKKFKGGLADESEETTKLHTAHHLLLAALQKVFGDEVKQRGSNITPERLRIDFSFDRKLTEEELQKVEDLVNEKIEEGLDVVAKEMPREKAEKIGAQMEFGAQYPDVVTVYFIQDPDGNVFSKEFCGGPHVENTSELGHFTIKKETSSSTGVRRIKAILE